MPSTLARPPTNRVVRLVVAPDYTTVSARTDIVPDIPFKHAANAVGGAGAQRRPAALRAGGLPLYHHGRQSPADAAAGPDALGGESAAGGPRRPARAGQSDAGRRIPHLHLRPPQRPGHHLPAGHGPALCGRARAESHRRGHALGSGGQRRLGPQQRPQLRCPDGYCGYAGTAATMPMTDTTRFPEAMPPSWTNEGDPRAWGRARSSPGHSGAPGRDAWPWASWRARASRSCTSMRRGLTTSHTPLDLPASASGAGARPDRAPST